MKLTKTLGLAFLVLNAATTHAQVTFDWATVGNPGNPGEIQPDGHGGSDTYGAVSSVYRISKHEVTNAQYTDFLNAVDPTGANPNLGGADPFLYNLQMSSNIFGGIDVNSSATNGSKYQLKPGRGNNPVVFVSFFDAMRFTNWLQNGQGSGSTESGAYTIGTGFAEIRNPSAAYFIPSENEWYKAAYHKNDGVTGNYWDYPTSTDTEPYSDNPSSLNTPDDTNTANFFKDDSMANGYDDGFAVTGSRSFNSTQNYLTDVGAYAGSLSPYGTFDQGGNVYEWNETVTTVQGSLFQGLRGGTFGFLSSDLAASKRLNVSDLSAETIVVGFRVASIPEPSTGLLVALGMLGLLLRRRP